MVAAHAVDAAAGRGGGGAEGDAFFRGPVRGTPEGGPCKQLADVHGPAIYISTYIIWIVFFDPGSVHGMACQDAVAKSGGVALYLCFNGGSHVLAGAAGYMTISPGRMFARRGT